MSLASMERPVIKAHFQEAWDSQMVGKKESLCAGLALPTTAEHG